MSWEPQQRRVVDDPVPTPAPASAGVLPALETAGPAALDSSAVPALQRSAGNAAVNRVLRQATLQRCAGGDCHCEKCAGEQEHGDAEEAEEVELALTPAQDVQGQMKDGLHTPELESMAAAAANLPGAEGAVAGAEAEEKEGQPAAPHQRALQRAIAETARARMVQRVATWSAGAVHEVNNLAGAVMNGTPAGVTWPTLNGAIFWSNAAARGALAKPTVKTTATGATFEAEVDNIPTSLGSFDETVLAAGPWTTVVPRATIATRFPTLAQCSTAGTTTFRVRSGARTTCTSACRLNWIRAVSKGPLSI